MMKKNAYKTGLAVIALVVFGGMTALAQTKTQYRYAEQTASAQTAKKGQEPLPHNISKMDMSSIDILKRDISGMNEPHQVLAMAYMQNVRTFAKALGEQAQGGTPLSADFARAAVAEISRSFDEARSHHQEHMRTISAGMPNKMSEMREMDAHNSKLKNAIGALEKDVQNYTLNSKQIAADCADVVKHIEEMSKGN